MKKYPVLPSCKNPFMLSYISAPRKPSPVKTDYIHPTVDIIDTYFNKTMIYGLNPINKLAKKCLDLDRACHNYFS